MHADNAIYWGGGATSRQFQHGSMASQVTFPTSSQIHHPMEINHKAVEWEYQILEDYVTQHKMYAILPHSDAKTTEVVVLSPWCIHTFRSTARVMKIVMCFSDNHKVWIYGRCLFTFQFVWFQ